MTVGIVDAWPLLRLLGAERVETWMAAEYPVLDARSRAAKELAESVAAAVATALWNGNGDALAQHPVGEVFRGLQHSTFELSELPTRAYNCAMRSGVNSVERLARTTVGEIMRWPDCGRATTSALLAFAAQAAIDGANQGNGGTARLDPIVDHVAVEADEPTPASMRDAITLFRQSLADRDAQILLERVLLPDGVTLEDLGRRYGVTRERIRQIAVRAEKRLRAFLASSSGDVVRERAVLLREELGLCAKADSIAAALGLPAADEFALGVLLWRAGPYEVDGDLVVLAPREHVEAVTRDVMSRCDDGAELPEVAARLAVVGVHAGAVEAWLNALGYEIAGGKMHALSLRTSVASAAEPDEAVPESAALSDESEQAEAVLEDALAPDPDEALFPPEYRAWNTAIIEYVFGEEHAGEPVYIDLEREDLEELGEVVGVSGRSPRSALVAAVRQTLRLEHGIGTFAVHERALWRWRQRGGSDAPPFVALLAVFCVAAEEMRSDQSFHSHNYYGRLCGLLGIGGDDEEKLRRDFQTKAHLFWEALNAWLRRAEGRRGMPTAEAFDRRVHVGLPISQALVRAVDRKGLREMFSQFRLQPRQRISRDDMVRLLDLWMPQAPVTQTLKQLWSGVDAKARIAEVACVELEAWDGTTSDTAIGATARAFVLAGVRRNPRRRIDFALATKGLALAEGTTLTLAEGAGEAAERSLEPSGGVISVGASDSTGLRQLAGSSAVSFPDLLVAHLRLHPEGGSSDQLLLREPRNVVVLEHDEENARYVEVDRAELGRDVLLLVSAAKERVVSEALERAARRGYLRMDSQTLAGLPDGWVAFQGVELIAAPESSDADLAPLEPLLLTQVVLGDGMRLPGHTTWHQEAQPEIRVTSLDPKRALVVSLEAAVSAEGVEPEEFELGHGHRLVLASLDKLRLGDGDYRVLVAGEKGEAIASANMHLRSGASPRDLTVDTVPLAHPIGVSVPLGALFAEPAADVDVGLSGARTFGLAAGDVPPGHAAPPSTLDGFDGFDAADERDEAPIAATARKSGDLPACLTGGAHHFLLPAADANTPRGLESRGVCIQCGYERVFPPPLPWGRRRRRRRQGSAPTREAALRQQASQLLAANPFPQRVEPIRQERGASDALILDALSYARGGGWPLFERLAARADDDPWSVSETARLLAALGHIDVSVNEETLRPSAWSVAPPTLVLVAHDEAVLAGARSKSLIEALTEAAREAGGAAAVTEQDAGPQVVALSGLTFDQLIPITNAVSTPFGPLSIEQSLPDRLSRNLPRLSEIGARLPELPEETMIADGLQRFNFVHSRWTSVATAEPAGAYRMSGLPRRYFVVVEGVPRVADNRLAKWIGGISEGAPMLAYSHAEAQLRVRLGAQLPGIYERAACLSSGRSPEPRVDGTVTYDVVPESVANTLFALLTS